MTRFLRATFVALAGLWLSTPALAAAVKPQVNYAGFQQPIKVGDTLQTPAPTASSGSINLPHGTAPSAPNDGDCWTTATGLYCRINGFTAGPLAAGIARGAGAPAASNDPIGTLYAQSDIADLYQQVVPTSIALAVVQAASAANTMTVTLGSAPTSGDLLVAICSGYSSPPGIGTGWTSGGSVAANVFTPAGLIVYRQAQVGDSATQTPCTSGGRPTVTLWEVSGAPQWAQVYETSASSSGTVSITTAHNNDLVLGAAMAQQVGSDPGAPPITGGLSANPTSAHGGFAGVSAATGAVSSSGSVVNFTYTPTGQGTLGYVLVLKPPSQGWQKISRLARVQNNGTDVSVEPMVLNCDGTTITCAAVASPYGVGDKINLTATGTGTVTTTGSPASGNLAKFSGATSVTNGDLSGDCTTSGALAITCTKTSGSSFGTFATQNAPTGSTQCVQVNSSGVVSGTGSGCGSASGATISGTPTTGNCAKWASSTSLGDAGAACGGGASGFIGARAYNNGTQTIGTATFTAITFGLEEYDTAAIHSTSSNTSRFTIPTGYDGKWRCTAGTGDVDTSSAIGLRFLQLRKNGTTSGVGMESRAPGSSSANIALQATGTFDLVATDYVEAVYFQNSGGNQTIGAATGNGSVSMECQWLGS